MSGKLALFSFGEQSYALPVASICHILPSQPLFQLPLLRSDLRGVFVDHGEVVPVLELARCLGIAPEVVAADPAFLVVYGAELGRVALPADRVVQMVEINHGRMRDADGTHRLPGVHACFCVSAQDYPLLDVDALLTAVPSGT